MKKIEKIILLTLCTISIIPIGILFFYWHSLDRTISSNPVDWGNFGSVLSGSFTLLGGLATSLTLFFFYRQQKTNELNQLKSEKTSKNFQRRQTQVIQKQIDSLTFEQYKNHRTHFIEIIQKEGSKNRIDFKDIEKLYHSIFNQNRPTYCEFFVDIKRDAEANNPLRICVEILEKINTQLKNPQDATPSDNIARSIFNIHTHLGVKLENSGISTGQILIDEKQTKIHAYKFRFQIDRLKNIIDHILFFSGNDTLVELDYPSNELELVKQIVKISANGEDSFNLDKNSRGAIGLYKIHEITKDKKHLTDINKLIELSLSSHDILCDHFQITNIRN